MVREWFVNGSWMVRESFITRYWQGESTPVLGVCNPARVIESRSISSHQTKPHVSCRRQTESGRVKAPPGKRQLNNWPIVPPNFYSLSRGLWVCTYLLRSGFMSCSKLFPPALPLRSHHSPFANAILDISIPPLDSKGIKPVRGPSINWTQHR
jgi:hypothetical protein